MTSRNQREGRYAGRMERRTDNRRRHVRHPYPPTTVWLGDEVLFTCPVPSSSAAWAVTFNREVKAVVRDEQEDGE
jgi:hypothetical protein